MGFLEELKALVPGRVLTKEAELAPYESDALTAYRRRPLAVVLPERKEEVVAVVRLCHRHGVPFVARGSGTSLSGGSLPVEGGIVLALNRMNRILRLDPKARIAVVEPGVVNLEVSKQAAPFGLLYAPDPSSQPVSTIGGNVAFNSGGAHCLKYGMTANHVLGLEIVTPTGEVVRLGGEGLEGVGPDLHGFFVGTEGLLGVALEITLRLLPRPEAYHTLLAAYDSLERAGEAVSLVIRAGLLPGAMEIMDRLSIEAAEKAVRAGYPQAEALLIVELEGPKEEVAEGGQGAPRGHPGKAGPTRYGWPGARRRGRPSGRGARPPSAPWAASPPTTSSRTGVVPRSRLGEALREIQRLSQVYGLRVANVFHAGDGNLHPLVLYDGKRPGELERAEELAGEILRLCVRLGGSLTGEHGIGVEKKAYMPEMFAPEDLLAMERVKAALDPKGLANRGKVLPEEVHA
jgi:glycolate oxidase